MNIIDIIGVMTFEKQELLPPCLYAVQLTAKDISEQYIYICFHRMLINTSRNKRKRTIILIIFVKIPGL